MTSWTYKLCIGSVIVGLQDVPAVMNQMRGFLAERGITMRKGPSYLATQLHGMLEDPATPLSGRLRQLILELKHEWDELGTRIDSANAELQRLAKHDDACHRLMEIPRLGPLVSTALVAAISNGITFCKNMRRKYSSPLLLMPSNLILPPVERTIHPPTAPVVG